MERGNHNVRDFDIAGQGATRCTCASFGSNSLQGVGAGDDARNVKLWKISQSNCLLNFQGHSSDITTVCFSTNEEEVYSGSFGGTVIVWDINSQRAIHSLKGHMAACTTIAPFPNGQQVFLATGSADCNLKIWDLRRKSCVQTFKGHKGQVNIVAFSPDSRWVASGGVDGTIKLWDLNTSRKLFEFSVSDSPVTCLKFNPQNLSLASGHQDRTVQYWDLENFGHISSTQPEANPIQKICFTTDEPRYLFSAGNDSLKLWDIEESHLLDNIESPWRGIEDLVYNKKDKVLAGLAINGCSFSMWCTDLNTIAFNGRNTEETRPAPPVQVKRTEERPRKAEEKVRSVDLSTTFIPVTDKPMGIAYEDFMPKANPESEAMRVLQEVGENHNNFMSVLQRRSENVCLILKWWESGNMPAALNGLGMMSDISVTADVLKHGLTDARNEWITLELCGQVLPLAGSLIDSKYESYIRTGISVVGTLLKQFRGVISSTLTAPALGGVDISREERTKRCEVCFLAFRSIADSFSLGKNMKRDNATGENAKELKKNLDLFSAECQRN